MNTVTLTIQGEPGEKVQIWYPGDHIGECPVVYTGQLDPDGSVTVEVPRDFLFLGRPIRHGGRPLRLDRETGPVKVTRLAESWEG